MMKFIAKAVACVIFFGTFAANALPVTLTKFCFPVYTYDPFTCTCGCDFSMCGLPPNVSGEIAICLTTGYDCSGDTILPTTYTTNSSGCLSFFLQGPCGVTSRTLCATFGSEENGTMGHACAGPVGCGG